MESHWKAIIERVLQSQRPLELDDDDLAELRAYLQSYGSGISIIDKALSRTDPAYAKKIADREKLRRCEKHNLELRTTTAAAKEKALLELSRLISEALHRIAELPIQGSELSLVLPFRLVDGITVAALSLGIRDLPLSHSGDFTTPPADMHRRLGWCDPYGIGGDTWLDERKDGVGKDCVVRPADEIICGPHGLRKCLTSWKRWCATKLGTVGTSPPPRSQPPQRENDHANPRDSNPTNPEGTNKYEALERLAPAARNAYLSFLAAVANNQRQLEDHEAWKWLKEHGFELPGGATYELSAFDTWTRYLRVARNAVGERKYEPRTKRQ